MTTAEKTPPEAATAADVVGGTEDPGGVGVAGGLVALTKAATRSRAAVKAGVGLSAESVRIALGRSTVTIDALNNRTTDLYDAASNLTHRGTAKLDRWPSATSKAVTMPIVFCESLAP